MAIIVRLDKKAKPNKTQAKENQFKQKDTKNIKNKI